MSTGVGLVTFLLFCVILLAHASALPFTGIDVQIHPLEQRFSYACPIGQCYYYCSPTGCRTGDGSYFPSYGIHDTWAYGARGMHGCNGGNCGFWGGCHQGYCNGHYNFQDCSSPVCYSGSFRGYGCSHGYCAVVCLVDVCHTTNLYDNPIKRQKYRRSTVQIGDFTSSGKNNNTAVEEMTKNHLREELKHLLTDCQQKLSSPLREHLTDEEYKVFKAELDSAMKIVDRKSATVDTAIITARYDAIKGKLHRYETRQVEYKKQPNVILLIVDALKKTFELVEAYEAGDKRYSYLANVDLAKVKALLDEKQKHLDYFVAAVKDKGPTDDPTVFTADLYKSYEVVEELYNSIKPKSTTPSP